MGKITFILGGARSGKSKFAVKLANDCSQKVAFIATCKPRDKEMKGRVMLHKNSRPKHWKTFEETDNPALLLKENSQKFEVVIIDCLTLLVSDFMFQGMKETAIGNKIGRIISVLEKINADSIIVSNEVGLGIVPENKLARDFRDVAGRMNQIVAEKSDNVFFMVSGIPLKIK